jgi:hypothetical protein
MSLKDYTREDLLRYSSNQSALYGARRVIVADGRGQGQHLVEVKTAGGLRATFMEDKCLDILDFECKGINMAFLSKNGLMALSYPETNTFSHYWAGGFMGTCGLRNVGPTCKVDGEFFHTHGRIGTIPAENVGVKVDDSNITITGITRETALFGFNLEMERTITIPIDGAEVTVHDRVNNLAPEDELILFLYHINFGFPFLSPDLKAEFPEGEIRGRGDIDEAVKADHAKFTAPIDGHPEYVFFHHPKAEKPVVKLTNNKLGIRADVKFDTRQFPVLAQWKCMRSGDYALGIEPTTNIIRSREGEIKNGYDVKVPAFGSLEYGFTVALGGA